MQQKHVASLAGSPLTGRCFTPEEMANVLAILAFDQGGVIADGP